MPLPVTSYKPLPPPQIEGGDKVHMRRELDNIRKSLDSIRKAIEELQETVFP